MAACPQCRAIYDPNQVEPERCQTCGCFLPRAGTVQPTSVDTPKPRSGDGTDVAPAATVPASTDRPSERLIRPRNLSPEYEQRVTEHWAGTHPAGYSPQETIHSDAGTTIEEEGLIVGMRNVVDVHDGKRGDYELAEVIGRGGMGEVWSANQSSLKRKVALKYPQLKHGGSLRDKFIFEVLVTGQLDHPNIVPIYDFARDTTGRLFYAMKLVDGRPWNSCIHDGSLSLQQNVEILMKVCDGLRFAHDRGVIHCDIKPHNIMIGRYGEVSVMDFGGAVRLDGGASGVGAAKASPGGTLAYMPPEIASLSRGQICPATDVYLLGAVLYEILSGEPPHPPPQDSKDPHQRISDAAKIAARNEIKALSTGGELADIAYKAMATDISARYQKVDDFQNAIRNYLAHAESIALAERGQEHLRRATDDGHGAPSSPGARFDEFDRARFAFDESVKLWPENKAAQTGLAETTVAYANYAYREGAYARGISLLDPKNKEHEPLLKKLTAARKNTNRLWLLLRAAAATIIVLGATFLTIFYIQKTQLQTTNESLAAETKRAVDAEDKASQLFLAEKSAREDADKNAREALRLQGVAEGKEREAVTLRGVAETKQLQAQEAERRAQRSAYVSEIGVADKAVQRNAFRDAKRLLARAVTGPKLGLQDWEWGHLRFLASNQESTDAFGVVDEPGLRVEAVAIQPPDNDQNPIFTVYAGTADGNVYRWQRKRVDSDAKIDTPPQPDAAAALFSYGEAVYSLALSSDGKHLAVAGIDDNSADGNSVKIWALPAREGSPPAIEFPVTQPAESNSDKAAAILSVEFSHRGTKLLTAAADRTARLWDLSSSLKFAEREFRGHLQDKVWSARFSPDDSLVVTACDDGTARVWRTADGTEAQRIRGRGAPVYVADFWPRRQLGNAAAASLVVFGGSDGRLLAAEFRPTAPAEASRPNEKSAAAKAVEHQLTAPEDLTQDPRGVVVIGTHDAEIRGIAVAPDDRHIVTASHDNTVAVWNLPDARQAITDFERDKLLRGHGGWVRALAIGGDDQVLSAGYDSKLRLWDWKKYNFTQVLVPPAEDGLGRIEFASVAVSPDGKWLATAPASGPVIIWNIASPSEVTRQVVQDGHLFQTTTGLYFDYGRKLLTSGGDNTTVVWDSQSGRQMLQIGGWSPAKIGLGTGWRGIADAAHDGSRIATGSDRLMNHAGRPPLARLWSVGDGQLQAAFFAADVGTAPDSESTTIAPNQEWPEATAIAFSPDDRIVFVGDHSGGCYLFDVNDPSPRAPFYRHRRKVTAAKFLTDGRLVTASNDGQAIVWRVAGNRAVQVQSLAGPGNVVAIDAPADMNRAYFILARGIHNRRAVLEIVDANTLRSTHSVDVRSPAKFQERSPFIRSVELHPSERRALVTVGLGGRSVYFVGELNWDGAPSFAYRNDNPLGDVSLAAYTPHSPDGVLTVGGRGARLVALNAATRSEPLQNLVQQASYRPQAGVNSVSFSQNGFSADALLACGGTDGSVKIWRLDGQDWRPQFSIPPRPNSVVKSICFDPHNDNRLLVAGSDGAMLLQREGQQWREGPKLAAVDGPVRQAVFSPIDGDKRILVVTDGAVMLLDGAANPRFPPVPSGEYRFQCAAFSPVEGDIAVAVGCGNDIYVLDGQMKPIGGRSLVGHHADVNAIAFAPNGMRLFSASSDYTIRVWNTSRQTTADPPPVAAAAVPNTGEGPPVDQDPFPLMLTLEGTVIGHSDTGHADAVTSLHFMPLPEKPYLVSVGHDGRAIIWPSLVYDDDAVAEIRQRGAEH